MKEKDDEGPQSHSTWEIMHKTFVAADLSLSKSLAVNAKGGRLRPIMQILELSCHGIPWIAFTLYVLYNTRNYMYEEVFFNLLIALLMDLIIVGTIKLIARRRRPAYNKDDMFATVSVDNFSFPSGHATRAYLVTWFILYHIKLAIPLRALLQVWCHVVGISRVILGRHHITDVIAGFIIGYFEFVLIEKFWISYENCNFILSFIK
ncbi:polyisoprenoid diphosphate/phosphate phosphohydrolase PLPP6-like [Styela clava]